MNRILIKTVTANKSNSWVHINNTSAEYTSLFHLQDSTSRPSSFCTADVAKLHPRNLKWAASNKMHVVLKLWLFQTMIYQTKSEWLTAPEEGKHSLWNMCLQWNTTTLNGLAMSETLMPQKKKVKISFQTPQLWQIWICTQRKHNLKVILWRGRIRKYSPLKRENNHVG